MNQILMLFFIVSLLVCPLFSFRYATGKYKNHEVSKLKAYLYFLFITSLPIILFIVLNLVLVGVEELSGKSIISESGARSLVVFVAFGLLLLLNLSVIFIVYIRKIDRDKKI
jgi:ABC-type arginine transport system permease subunit